MSAFSTHHEILYFPVGCTTPGQLSGRVYDPLLRNAHTISRQFRVWSEGDHAWQVEDLSAALLELVQTASNAHLHMWCGEGHHYVTWLPNALDRLKTHHALVRCPASLHAYRDNKSAGRSGKVICDLDGSMLAAYQLGGHEAVVAAARESWQRRRANLWRRALFDLTRSYVGGLCVWQRGMSRA